MLLSLTLAGLGRAIWGLPGVTKVGNTLGKCHPHSAFWRIPTAGLDTGAMAQLTPSTCQMPGPSPKGLLRTAEQNEIQSRNISNGLDVSGVSGFGSPPAVLGSLMEAHCVLSLKPHFPELWGATSSSVQVQRVGSRTRGVESPVS